MRHPTGQLAGYVAGTLPEHETTAVEAHLARCAACRQEAAGWRRVAEGVQVRAVTAPASILTSVRRRLAAANAGDRAARPPVYRAVPAARPVARAARLLAHQWRLVGWRVWAVSALVLVAGMALAWRVPVPAEPVLAVIVPLAAALAVAGACAGDELADELFRATPTSVRTILLARLTLVLGAILVVAVSGSLVLSLAGAGGPGRLLAAWLGPMALLAAVSFTVSVAWCPAVGLSVALTLWVLRVLVAVGHFDGIGSAVVEAVWRTSWPTLVVAGALLAGGLVVAPKLAAAQTVRFGL